MECDKRSVWSTSGAYPVLTWWYGHSETYSTKKTDPIHEEKEIGSSDV